MGRGLGVPLAQLVQVRGRFHRSVHLPRDFETGTAPANYFAPPAILDIARQILGELDERHGARAWTLTGPYGTGKSAFALFLANILASLRPKHPAVRRLRREFRHRARRMQPLLVQADRGPLLPKLLDALVAAGRAHGDRTVFRQAVALGRRRSEPAKVVALLSLAAERSPGGLVLMVDELGKYLEFAAQHNDDEDLYLLQQIAEAAARTRKPLLFLAVLHSGFADYLQGGATARRAEWQKVQGRFRDIPFSLPDQQLLGLVSRALKRRFSGGTLASYRKRLEAIARAPGFPCAAESAGQRKLLASCLPLHPTVSLILWPLFRSKIAQNERSLFAFLTSHEPYGFREFLHNASVSEGHMPLYELPRLYDYVIGALGLASITGRDARQWSLMAAALDRVPAAAPPVARDLVKCIGLLSVYGGRVGLRPTEALLKALLADGPHARDADESIALLQRESIALFRRHTGAFTLWEGSDVDLEAEFENARRHRGNRSLPVRLGRTARPRPLIPRRHYIETGTLRWLEVRVVGADAARRISGSEAATATDGVVLMLTAPELGPRAGVRRARTLSRSGGPGERPRLVALPRNVSGLEDSLDEIEGWEWVRENVSELAGDSVARQEAAARLEAARLAFERLAGPTFGLPGHVLDPGACRWFYDGEELLDVTDPSRLQSRVSKICAHVFHACPPLHNELLNRRRLSSAAARARRELIERIIQSPQEKNLGIQGFPPHFSMYQSLLKAGGFHGSLGLGPPSKPEWRPVWEEIERFLDSTRAGPRPVTDLMEALRRPPFGLREGPLPVLVALALAVKGEDAALYEEGVFVSDAMTEAMERLVRRPETFALRSHRLDEAEAEVLQAVEKVQVPVGVETPPGGLLGVVRRLVGLAASLSPYARRTRRISPAAQAVRERLLRATDPRALLFQELPQVLEVRLSADGAAGRFAIGLAEAVRELVMALPRLLDEVEETTRQAFGSAVQGEALRCQLRDRASALVLQTAAGSVFVRTLAMTDPGRDWRGDVARVVAGGKPPAQWSDADARSFPLRVRTLAVEMERVEALLAQRDGDTEAKVFRLEVLEPESVQLFSGMLSGETAAPVEALAERLFRAARDSGLDDRSQLTALLAAAVRAHAAGASGSQDIRERSA